MLRVGKKGHNKVYVAVIILLYSTVTFSSEGIEQQNFDLPTIVIKAKEESKTEDSGNYKAKSSRSASKLNLSLKETPQSISVVTRDQIEQRGLSIIDDILAASPGVYVTKLDSERSSYYARGFSINNKQIDGIPLVGNDPRMDNFFFDRVEIIKGASGLTGSTGNPSATINMIRKRPTKEFSGNVATTFGSWDNTRVEADVSIPLTEDGSIRSRVMAAHTDKESFMEFYSLESTAAMAVVEADIAENTLATIGFQYQDNNPKGSTWGAVPYWNADGSLANLPRNFSMAAKWNEISQKNQTVYAGLQHNFSNDWLIKGSLSYSKAEESWITAYGGSGFLNPVDGSGLGMWNGIWPYSNSKTISGDIYATGPFQLFGRQHDIVVGYSGHKLTENSENVDTTILYPNAIPDYRKWTGDIPKPTWTKTGAGGETTTKISGTYATIRLSLADPLKMIIGGRYSTFEDQPSTWGTNRIATTGETRDLKEFTPFIGLLYDINDKFTAYASYTDMFTPSDKKDRNNNYVDPVIGESYEVGIKGDVLDGKLLVTGAVFQSKQKDLAVLDKSYNDDVAQQIANGADSSDFKVQTAYMSSGSGLKVEGFELEAIGQIREGWNVSAGYTYVNSISSANASSVNNIPQNQFKLFSSYTLPNQLWQGADRLTIGGGVSWQSEISNEWGGAPANSVGNGIITQDSYFLANAFGTYKFNDHLSANLNINNLFDKKYYTNVGFYNGVYWGEPRNVTFTLRAKF